VSPAEAHERNADVRSLLWPILREPLMRLFGPSLRGLAGKELYGPFERVVDNAYAAGFTAGAGAALADSRDAERVDAGA